MKKTFLVSALLGVAGWCFFAACSGDEGKDDTTDNTPAQAVITAEAPVNTCPSAVVQLRVSAEGATSFEWYRGETLLAGNAATCNADQSGIYYAVGVNSFDGLKGDRSAGFTVTITPCAPAQATVGGNITACPSATEVLLAADADNATSFKWYKGTELISAATAATYLATVTSGSETFYAAGVNAQGEGTKSAAHTVTYYSNCNDISFAAQMTGIWDVSETAIVNAPADNAHRIFMEYVNDATIRIKNLTGNVAAANVGNEVTATLNAGDRTFTIAYQEITPTWEKDATTHFAKFITDMPFADNVGQGVTQTVAGTGNDLTVTWEGTAVAGPSGSVNACYLILLCENGAYSAQRGIFANTVWTKR